MRISIIFLLLLSTTSICRADDWGRTGHRTTAAIAETYLSAKAKKNIARLLGEETLVTVSTYGDEIKGDPKMRKYSPWHYVNIAPGKTYAEAKKNPAGDLIVGIRTCKERLTSDDTSRKDKIFYLKMLVHLMGDLHQPLHAGRAEDKGGNDIQVRWWDSGTNLHSVWDTKIIESYGMSYSELATNFGIKSKEDYKKYSQGTLMDWVNESRKLANTVYASAKTGQKLSYNYLDDNIGIITKQLEIGGIRLAAVLNELFG